MEHHGFPADETLAEFIDGRLDAESRQRVVEHLAACPECYDTFLTATEFAAISPEDAARGGEVVHGRFGRGAWYAQAAVVAMLAIGLAAFRGPIGTRYAEFSFGRRTGMARLVDAANQVERRPVQARFSGGFEYREPKPVFRGPGDMTNTENDMLPLLSAWATLEKEAQDSEGKEYGAAVGDVFMGKPVEGAERLKRILLESTAKKNPRDAIASSDDKRLLNDFAAAWIAGSERRGEQRTQDLELALAAAARALELDPKFAEAAYNRALALDHLDRHKEAIEAWNHYKTMETDPRWLKEAQDAIDRAEEDLKYEATPQSR